MGQETKKEWVEQKEKRWFDSCIELKPFLGEIYDEIHAQDKPECEHPKDFFKRYIHDAKYAPYRHWVDVCLTCDTIIQYGNERIPLDVAVEKPQDAPEIPMIDMRLASDTNYPDVFFMSRLADCVRWLYGKQGVKT